MSSRGPGQRAGLTRTAVLAAARELLSEHGIDGVTMRALASALDVAPNTLYSHVQGKTAVVDALLDDLLSAVVDPGPHTPDPIAGVVAMMTSTYDVLLTRPDLVPYYLSRQGARGPEAIRLGVTLDALLARAGVAATQVVGARTALIVHAIGSAAFATGGGDPAVASTETRASFGTGLRWLLTGITATPSPKRPGTHRPRS